MPNPHCAGRGAEWGTMNSRYPYSAEHVEKYKYYRVDYGVVLEGFPCNFPHNFLVTGHSQPPLSLAKERRHRRTPSGPTGMDGLRQDVRSWCNASPVFSRDEAQIRQRFVAETQCHQHC
ncbi:hypothetical protein L484_012787 [Morus notabilis]|uniref:Uncharacterized protein n=1 Tax=Morus notabilis TaxID=981085 RepID=W9SIW6_9ROSA|nr:hypothetical protein L484_012787 [Morus notabilis]